MKTLILILALLSGGAHADVTGADREQEIEWAQDLSACMVFTAQMKGNHSGDDALLIYLYEAAERKKATDLCMTGKGCVWCEADDEDCTIDHDE